VTKLLLAVHVLAAIIAVGPVTVAASMFPPTARRALADPADPRALASVRLLNRVCRVYAAIGVTVPVFGFAVAGRMRVMGDPWLVASIVLTALAAAALAGFMLPRQRSILASIHQATTAGPEAAAVRGQRVVTQLTMFTGVFNLLWATVTVLMIVRPGSTTGA
jgi:hypothetical protein